MKISIVVASLGRPKDLSYLLETLRHQTKAPNQIILSVESAADLPRPLDGSVDVTFGPRGACAQRNRGIEVAIGDSDLIVFLDDDYVPSRFFLEDAANLFTRHPDIVGATGLVLADGVGRGGIAPAEALAIVEKNDARPRLSSHKLVDVHHAYGCNMIFRSSALSTVRFDENLPLYSWQEDVDFAAQALRYGRVVETDAFSGVHLGASGGRTSGVRFGYSQVINPLYLLRKGTMRPSHAARIVGKNLIANHVRALRPERHIDRIGRLKGNWIGVFDCLRGKLDPRRVLKL